MDYIIEGDRIGFTPLKKEYVEKYQNWVNDLEVSQYITIFDQVLTVEEERQWYEGGSGGNERSFTIHYLPEDEPIGNCGLHNVDRGNGRAELGIMIGEREYWNRGLGTEAVKLATDFGFTALNLHSINLSLKGFNERAKRAYEKAGYEEAGRIRDFWRVDGKYYDQIIMEVLRGEFYEENEHLIRNRYLFDPEDAESRR